MFFFLSPLPTIFSVASPNFFDFLLFLQSNLIVCYKSTVLLWFLIYFWKKNSKFLKIFILQQFDILHLHLFSLQRSFMKLLIPSLILHFKVTFCNNLKFFLKFFIIFYHKITIFRDRKFHENFLSYIYTYLQCVTIEF